MPRAVLFGGQGYPVTETMAGLPTLKKRLEAKDFDVLMVSHAARQQARDFLHGYKGFRAMIGDSLGAGVAALYAQDLDGVVDFVGGFQPSAWDPIMEGPINNRYIVLPKNIKTAYCIWDPVFVDTAGLGNAHYVVSSTAKTMLTLTEHRGAHPDDWGYSQDLMFKHLMQAVEHAK